MRDRQTNECVRIRRKMREERPDQTGEETRNPTVDASIKRLHAKKWPLMRRADHQLRLQAQHEKYSSELARVRRRNRLALASISQQEERLRRIQSSLLRCENSVAEGGSENNGHAQREDGHRQDCSVTRSMPCGEVDADALTAGEEKLDSRDLRSVDRGRTESGIRRHVLQPIKDFTIVDVAHDSFTVRWEVDVDIKPTIVDYEVCYTCPSGDQVTSRLSRWCLGEPVPDGQFVIGRLETCAKYRGISMRCLCSSRGWSDRCDPIDCVTTLSKGE